MEEQFYVFEVMPNQFTIIYRHAPKFVVGIKKLWIMKGFPPFHLAFCYLKLGHDCKHLLDKKGET